MATLWRGLEKAGFSERLTMTSLLRLSRAQRTTLVLPVHGKEWHEKHAVRRKVQCVLDRGFVAQCSAVQCDAVGCDAQNNVRRGRTQKDARV